MLCSFDPTVWAKEHKKDFVAGFIERSGATPQAEPSAVFMAGLPGAGKTEFSKNLVEKSELSFIRIDMDEIAEKIEGYIPERADVFRKAATILLENVFSAALKNKLNFVMDGTFGGPKALHNITRAINHGYEVKAAYISQDPKLAWEFTVAREKLERRAITREGFVASYFKTQSNLRDIPDGVALVIVEKSRDNGVERIVEVENISEIDKFLVKSYNKESLIEYITKENI